MIFGFFFALIIYININFFISRLFVYFLPILGNSYVISVLLLSSKSFCARSKFSILG
ncbi:hypothetical protein GLOIN_2v1528849, partial [Rhizophagus irregularis DAOM 181602=DAOM 197198]